MFYFSENVLSMSRPWLPSPPSVDAAFFSANPQPSNGLNMEDWNQAGNFVNKPVRGWLHPDQKLSDGGITYGVRVSTIIHFKAIYNLK